MAHYLKGKDIKDIENKLKLLANRNFKLTSKISQISNFLKNEKAKEFLFHGVLRRLKTIERCVENIYSIFPIRRKELLSNNELSDVVINLHAFFINIFGLLDNMAWVVAHENQLGEKIRRTSVSLYSKKIQDILDNKFKGYLNSPRMKKWHDNYLKNYRDALSHRIPLYVPPKFLSSEQIKQEQTIEKQIREAKVNHEYDEGINLLEKLDGIGSPAPAFTHSFSEPEQKLVVLHAQVITDFGTIEEVVEKFCEMFEYRNN